MFINKKKAQSVGTNKTQTKHSFFISMVEIQSKVDVEEKNIPSTFRS